MKPKLLIVDDDDAHRKMLEAVMSAEGFAVSHAADGVQAVNAVEKEFYNLVLMDIRMNRMDGIEALQRIKHISPGIPIIIMTAYASVNTAVNALKSGAYDYLTKPLDIDELKILVNKARQHQQLKEENRNLRERLDDRFDFPNIIGRSRAMKSLFGTLSLVAPTEATVLILGESGTGKELIANALHHNSLRKENPFVTVNCAALPEHLLESELFGHEKGAFTGADRRKKGRFLQAHTGSVFLDEIGEMPIALQPKILRVLQEQKFEPLGSGETLHSDIRIIAATNRDLTEEIKTGRFREDLFYRLNVVALTLPPLRRREEDILLLADFFLKKYVKKNRRMIKRFTPRAMDCLMRYAWPGNVRELENAVERAVILARGDVITPEDFPETVMPEELSPSSSPPGSAPARSLKDMEKEMILRTLHEKDGNRTHTAKILGISRRTLQLKLKEYGVN